MVNFRRTAWPGYPENDLDINWGSPLSAGLVWFTAMCERGELAAHDLVSRAHQSSEICHASSTPVGSFRRRTDYTANLYFPFFERQGITTGPFSCAVYGQFDAGTEGRNAISNNGGNNQWRILVNYKAGNESGAVCFFTYDNVNSSYSVGVSAAMVAHPAWYVGVRRIDGELQLWRDGILLGSAAAATSRNVNGSKTSTPNMGWSTNTGSGNGLNALGFIGCGALWNRALSGDEIMRLATNRWEMFKPHTRAWFIPAAAASFKSAWASGCNSVIQGVQA